MWTRLTDSRSRSHLINSTLPNDGAWHTFVFYFLLYYILMSDDSEAFMEFPIPLLQEHVARTMHCLYPTYRVILGDVFHMKYYQTDSSIILHQERGLASFKAAIARPPATSLI
jgi:hypothetical protein